MQSVMKLMTFEGDEMMSYVWITIPVEYRVVESLMGLCMQSLLKVKCCLGFCQKDSCVCLTAEVVDEVTEVKLVVT